MSAENSSLIAMRFLFGFLTLGGCFFAIQAWVLMVLPIGIFMPEYRYTTHDTVISLTGSFLSVAGYFVWVSWISFVWRSEFLFESALVTHAISFVNHLGWLVWFPFFRRTNLWEFMNNLHVVAAWIIVNMCIAIFSMWYFSARELPRSAHK